MLQTGDPTGALRWVLVKLFDWFPLDWFDEFISGTGKGGECIWGGKFEDELVEELKHNTRGVLSMANNGPDTNGSQFFITYGAQQHLDLKYTVFGR